MDDRSIGRRRAVRALALGGIAAVVSRSRSPVAAAEVELAKVPPGIRDAAKQVVPAAKWSSADRDKEDGQDVYELAGEDGKGRKVVVAVAADGKVTEVRTAVPPTEVPRAAWEAVDRKFPAFEATSACEVRQGDDLRRPSYDDFRAYEVGGVYERDRRAIIEVTAEGEITEMEREVGVNVVPQPVTAALKGKMPKFQTATVYEVSEDGTVIGYQFEGKRPKDKKDIDVFVSADGKAVEIEE